MKTETSTESSMIEKQEEVKKEESVVDTTPKDDVVNQ